MLGLSKLGLRASGSSKVRKVLGLRGVEFRELIGFFCLRQGGCGFIASVFASTPGARALTESLKPRDSKHSRNPTTRSPKSTPPVSNIAKSDFDSKEDTILVFNSDCRHNPTLTSQISSSPTSVRLLCLFCCCFAFRLLLCL